MKLAHLLVLGLIAAPTLAQGRISRRPIRHPGFRISAVRVERTEVAARIVDGIADTRIKMRLRNDGGRPAEKILVLPLPKGATADQLKMMVNGKLETGEVLDKNRARGIYESIVRSRKDPALLEYFGHGMLRLRVFPVPARGHQDVEVRFRMLLPESGGLFRYDFPARAVEGGQFSLAIQLESKKAIKNVYSPLGGFDVVRKDDHNARASYECKGRPQRDPSLFYGLSERDFGLNLLTYRPDANKDGYFLMMLAPKRDWKNEKPLRKTISFVVDTSGSMQGQKIEQAKGALRFFLRSLRPEDHFNIVPFSTEARPFASAPVAATAKRIDEAVGFCDKIEARGGTNIEEALRTALAAEPVDASLPIVVFLTDGLPTVGITQPKDILASIGKHNGSKSRIFVFGVGHDVNTHLLDKISDEHRGARDYVQPGENLEVKVSALFEKVSHPVLSDLAISVDGVRIERLAPKALPDLFRGSRLVVAGRYRGQGAVALRLKGKVHGADKEFVYDASFPQKNADHDFVATLWAQRRVGQLLDALRLKGHNKELVAEIKRLGKEHGIVTPYTSNLIVEDGMTITRGWSRRRGGLVPGRPSSGGPTSPAASGGRGRFGRPGPDSSNKDKAAEARLARDLARAGIKAKPRDRREAKREDERSSNFNLGRGAMRSSAGKRSVELSKKVARLRFGEMLDDKGRAANWRTQKVAGRVFHLVGGVWIENSYRKEHEKALRKIEAFSPEWFELVRKNPKIAKALSFSTAMLVVLDGKAIEITPPQPKKKASKSDGTSAGDSSAGDSKAGASKKSDGGKTDGKIEQGAGKASSGK